MDLYWISVCVFLLCIYIAQTVHRILVNQKNLNDARYNQIKKIQDQLNKIERHIENLKRENQ